MYDVYVVIEVIVCQVICHTSTNFIKFLMGGVKLFSNARKVLRPSLHFFFFFLAIYHIRQRNIFAPPLHTDRVINSFSIFSIDKNFPTLLPHTRNSPPRPVSSIAAAQGAAGLCFPHARSVRSRGQTANIP